MNKSQVMKQLTASHDAGVLATMIADPHQMTARKLDAWVREVTNRVTTAALSNLLQSPGAST